VAGTVDGPLAPEPAPTFALSGPGGDFALTEHRGRIVVLHFWATWNELSPEGLDALAGLHEEVADAGVAIVGIAEDEDAEAALGRWAEGRPALPFPLVADPGGTVARLYGGVELLPTTVVVDRQGLLRARHTGVLSPDGLLDLLGPVLIEDDEPLADFPAAESGVVVPLPAEDVPELVRAGAVLVDVREAEARRAEGVLPYALHRPLASLKAQDLPANFSTPLIFVSDDGAAEQAAEQALGWGYAGVYLLDGGVAAWEAAGLPLEPAPAEAPEETEPAPVVPTQSVLG
jgi:rhodanese-related sulfurtransferase/thiol-disulfide isomerase/thioredoxin